MAMANKGEKTCPLCTEEMDLTDQQLKPCKCGYEICVWCWHQIMDLAEKDDTEGRCPACRTLYDKEKIVGMATNCERLVAGINSERRQKSQKAKSKASEGRKHLSDVRVIQRNLVYVIGLPVAMADEATLEKKEFFGQYGKVLKVSISRLAGTGQHSSNNSTCNVYITYSKEEEAVRCIQSVHGFIMDGRSLRACYGTTKYCHTWLRNMPCNNPDCLYLHEIGTQEDSFIKDEIISAYTRSRVLQIAGASNNSQHRSGNILPPPVDDYCSNAASSDKIMVKDVTNNPAHQSKGSLPNENSGRSSVLPAAASWGLRVSGCWKQTSSVANLQEHDLLKDDAFTSPSATAVTVGVPQASAMHAAGKISSITEEICNLNSGSRSLACSKQCNDSKNQTTVVKSSDLAEVTDATINSEDLTRHSSSSGLYDGTGRNSHSVLCSEDSDGITRVEDCDLSQHQNSVSSLLFSRSTGNTVGGSRQYSPEHGIGAIELLTLSAAKESEETCASKELFEWNTEFQTHALPSKDSENDEALLPVNKVFEFSEHLTCQFLPNLCSLSKNSNHSSDHNGPGLVISGSRVEDVQVDDLVLGLTSGHTALMKGCRDNEFSIGTTESSKFCESTVERIRYLGRSNGYTSMNDKIANLNLGESTIISSILSMDFDAWDGSLTHGLAGLLKKTDSQNGYLGLSSSHKPQDSNQSRFSFARQDDFMDQAACECPSSNDMEQQQRSSAGLDGLQNRESCGDIVENGSTVTNFVDFQNPPCHSSLLSNKASVLRTQISAPPGFSVPGRASPPGFSSQQKMDHGNQLFANSSMPTIQHQLPPLTGNIDNAGDLEFIDPAILAVSKERFPLGGMSNSLWDSASVFQAQQTLENDARIQLLMQPALSLHQNLQYSDHAVDMFAHMNDAHIQTQLAGHGNGLRPHYLGQLSSFQQSRNIGMSNSPWDSNTIQSGANLAIAGILRNDRPELNKYNSVYDELRFHKSTLGDLYSRAFGI